MIKIKNTVQIMLIVAVSVIAALLIDLFVWTVSGHSEFWQEAARHVRF